jgi:DNA mismatch repair protein MutS2
MTPGTLKALEFDRIVEVVVALAVTPLGSARLAALTPGNDQRRIEAALAITSETVRFLADHPGLPLRAPADLEASLMALAVEGRALDARQLIGFANFLESVEQCAHTIRRVQRDSFPLLGAVVASIPSFDREVGEVRRTIDPTGEVFDHATHELRMIRDRLRKQRTRLRGTLESYIRGKETAKYLQDQVVTDRNGRYVLMVRAEHRGAIPGIMHGSSASGATLFLEPLSTVEINNDIVALQEQEAEEVRRILLALTDAFRGRPIDLQKALDAAVDLDVAQAKARFARMLDGVAPHLSSDGALELPAARHPLLIPAVHARQSVKGEHPARPTGPVPVDIAITPPTSVLVITGPNTGGKTVALKTAGLLALMAQAGLHVPAAAGARVPVFRSVFADIGDEQSIDANLSTFSSHITNIASMDRGLQLPALVLLDEIGAGTDPTEGGALGMAIIDHLRRRGAMVVATTHFDTLKTYASTTPGVVCAAFGFAQDTFEPTYRLVYGSPGRSLAFEAAGRLGLPASIIEEARQYRSQREAQLAEHLAKIDHQLHDLEHERRLVARERAQIAEQETRHRQRDDALRDKEEQLRRRVETKLEDKLREARREVDAIVDDVKRRAASLVSQVARRSAATQTPLSTGETGAVRSDARAALDRVFERVHSDAPVTLPAASAVPAGATAKPGVRPVPGDRVAVGPLGFEGTVQVVYDREAEVNVRGKRLRASLDELRVLAGGAAATGGRVNISIQVQSRDEGVTDLNVVGCSVDEALSRTDKFLDDAMVAEQRSVRIIHGHGTGQLRRAIAEFLGAHPLVAKFGAAPAEHGGSGATVVELKE